MTATDKRSGPDASLPDLALDSNSIAQPQPACRITMAACTSLLLIAVALFASGALLSRRQPDYSRKDAREAVETVALTTLGPGADAINGQQV